VIRRHPVLVPVTLAYLTVVGWVTLGPQPLDARGMGILRQILRLFARNDLTSWVTYDLVESSANVAMFVPIGLLFLLLLGSRYWWLAFLIGVALTCAIEFTQLFLPGRYSDPRDILMNSLGALVGVAFGLLLSPRRVHD
jgi:glycopeptide antibiotics resistance protein